MTKPEMRVEVTEIRNQLRALLARLDVLHAELHNRPPRTCGEAMSDTMTDDKRRLIIAFHRANPEVPQHRIATLYNVNQGRVSETLSGKRT